MKYILGTLMLLFTHMAMAADSSGGYAIWGAGQKSCFSYNKTRKTDDDGYYHFYLLGYLTAFNAHTPETYRISGKKTLSDILLWLDDYCTGKPVHGFDQAILEFIAEHYPKRYKRSTSGKGR